jgi:hypothetical protein
MVLAGETVLYGYDVTAGMFRSSLLSNTRFLSGLLTCSFQSKIYDEDVLTPL